MVHSVLGLTLLSFGLPILTALWNPFLLLIFTCGLEGRGMCGEYPDTGDSWGGKYRGFLLKKKIKNPSFTACSHCHK